jgi:hypothetical protein
VAVSPTDIVNEAIQRVGDNQPLVTGSLPNFDDSPAGKAARVLYTPVVQAVGRRFEWDMARNTVALTVSGNTPPLGWSQEYLYPGNGIEVWQITPQTLADPNNWVVANTLVGGVQTKVIHASVANARAVYNNSPGEALWDPLFRQAVVAQLASAFAMALFGKPDVAQAEFDMGNAIAALGELRDS